MFLLVPAHPGFPGQIPQSRKTVVCVCVCIKNNYSVHLWFLLVQLFIYDAMTTKQDRSKHIGSV